MPQQVQDLQMVLLRLALCVCDQEFAGSDLIIQVDNLALLLIFGDLFLRILFKEILGIIRAVAVVVVHVATVVGDFLSVVVGI